MERMTPQPAPALKETIFGPTRIVHIADELGAVSRAFDRERFLAHALGPLDTLSLMERLRHVTLGLHAALPMAFRDALVVLRQLAPRLNNSFATLILPDFVALYGLDDVDTAMEALRFFTRFGSSEFAIRPFLRRDLLSTLAVMEAWARDTDAHVRRLASEGSRPRLPWSFRLEALVADPARTLPILEALRADPSPYVRKSVANHLNDITKDHPAWVVARLRHWPRDDVRTAWITRHALRSLIKQGEREALAIVGAGEEAAVDLVGLAVTPDTIRLGEAITLAFTLKATGAGDQKLVVDYAITYVRRAERSSRKVFKLKTLVLEPGATATLSRRQIIRDFSTRTHHPGRHAVEVLVNGRVLGRTAFVLLD